MSHAHVDLATLASISRMTTGQLYHYHPFHASIHAPLLLNDLRWNLSRPQASCLFLLDTRCKWSEEALDRHRHHQACNFLIVLWGLHIVIHLSLVAQADVLCS